jgi:hypothetical protein
MATEQTNMGCVQSVAYAFLRGVPWHSLGLRVESLAMRLAVREKHA